MTLAALLLAVVYARTHTYAYMHTRTHIHAGNCVRFYVFNVHLSTQHLHDPRGASAQ